jgi:hypothetical protein
MFTTFLPLIAVGRVTRPEVTENEVHQELHSRCTQPGPGFARSDMVRTTSSRSTDWSPQLLLSRCGKNYMANQSVVPPGGQFVLPSQSAQPLLAFRCAPVFRPYLEEDAKSAAIVIDTPIVYDWIDGAEPISLPSSGGSAVTDLGSLQVNISVGSVHTTANVPLNATGIQIPIDISKLISQKTTYNVSCSATYSAPSSSKSQEFNTYASLLYLPDTTASVTKTDLRTGALWVRPADGKGGPFAPFIPQGFYVAFDPYLVSNLSVIDDLKAAGFVFYCLSPAAITKLSSFQIQHSTFYDYPKYPY